MNRKTIYFCLTFIAWLNSLSASAFTAEPISFQHIGLREGLSQSTVFSIAQDQQGHMWFATYDGVNKYDGYEFKVYQHDSNNPLSLANDIARVVRTDSRGRIWIGTRDGLSLYDAGKDHFRNYFYETQEKKTQINDIIEVEENTLLTATPEGLFFFRTEESRFVADSLSPAFHRLDATTLRREGEQIYIGTYEGLYLYSIASGELNPVTQALEQKRIQSVLRQSPIRLWVATEGAGLYLVNPLNGEVVKNYRHTPGDPKSISSNYIRSLALDAQNRLWIGTFNDLNIYDESNDSFRSYTNDPVDDTSLSQNSVRSIFKDSQGGMWLGTYFGGLNYYHPLKNRFRHIRQIPYRNSLNENIVSCMVEDERGHLWIGTNDGGVNLYDPQQEKFVHYTLPLDARTGIGSNNVKAIYVDEPAGKVYIGTHAGGLYTLDRNSGRISSHHSRNSDLPDDNVYAITPAEDGWLWLGTLAALVRFHPGRQLFQTIHQEAGGKPFTHKQITCLFRDSRDRLWIAGEEDVSVYRWQDGALYPATLPVTDLPLRHMFTHCIHESAEGVFWIGTRQGVYRYSEKDRTIRHYTTHQGLPNNVVYGILEDSFGRLWMSTNKGLACMQTETEKFRNFTEADGLQSNQFNSFSYCRTSARQFYFGGINGITVFRPELLLDNPHTPPVIINRLRLFHRTVRPDDETGILNRHISLTDRITLTAAQSSFALDFVVSNYIAGPHNTFAYQLQGYDKEWYELTDIRSVSYSNLPHGTYRFLVKAANNDGLWNHTPTELEIVILPVWYRTWWAILLFFLIFCTVSIQIIRFFWMRQQMKSQLEMERKDKERQEEINQMKMRFFIDISHELRTPLTLIMAPLQEVLNRVTDRWTRNQLEHIRRNTNRLLHLVNQLMDYRRAELGVFRLQVRQTEIHATVKEIFLMYDKAARTKNIRYTLHSETEGKLYLADTNFVELMLHNLLSNAFKFTGEGKSIEVTLKEEDGWLLLRVCDTGKGIPLHKQKKIFERFYQIGNEHTGSGIGLSVVQRLAELHHGHIEVESEEGQGSSFTICLPQQAATYLPEEWADAHSETATLSYTTNAPEMYVLDTDKNEEMPVEEQGEKKGTLLLVEDNPEILRYLREGLSAQYRILTAGHGEEALERLKEEEEIDMVITDVMMPVMDGIRLCKTLKQNIRTCHIPVLILSAKGELKDQQEGLNVGADDYIPKPFTLSILTTKVQNILRTRRGIIDHYVQSGSIEPEKITFNALDEELLRKAVAVVEKHMDDIEFTADEFAREMNMSRSNLHLKLKAVTGESTIDFIRKIRFNEACKLLRDGRYSIAQVSTMVGFNTPSYFATSFKKYFGCLPTEYIKSIRG